MNVIKMKETTKCNYSDIKRLTVVFVNGVASPTVDFVIRTNDLDLVAVHGMFDVELFPLLSSKFHNELKPLNGRFTKSIPLSVTSTGHLGDL